jgi:glycerol-3-phosphate acyltransferase PlsY
VASIAFGLALPLAGWGLQAWKPGWFVNILNNGSGDHQSELVFALLISLLILVRHRTNIVRLLRGEELSFKKKD